MTVDTAHMVKKGRSLKGEEINTSRLNPDAIRTIRDMHTNGFTQVAIAKHFNVARYSIQMVLSGRTWRHVE